MGMQTPLGDQLFSIGALAKLLDRTPSLVRKLERDGVLPPALRLAGSNRRVYRPEDVRRIQEIQARRLADRRRTPAEGP